MISKRRNYADIVDEQHDKCQESEINNQNNTLHFDKAPVQIKLQQTIT